MRFGFEIDTSEIDAQIEGLGREVQLLAFVGSNLKYMPRLEDRHSRQAPMGIYAPQAAALAAQVAGDIRDMLMATPGGDLVEILAQGLNLGALGVARALADKTPVDTGRAKNSWIVIPALRRSSQTISLMVGFGGRLQPEGGYALAEPMSAEAQKAKRRQLNATRTKAKLKAKAASADALAPKRAKSNSTRKAPTRRQPSI